MDAATATLSMCPCHIFSSSLPSLRMHVRVSSRIPHLSASAVDKTLSQINNSGIIACLRANRSFFLLCFSLFIKKDGTVIKKNVCGLVFIINIGYFYFSYPASLWLCLWWGLLRQLLLGVSELQ